MREKRYYKDMKGTQEEKKEIKTKSNQIKINDGERLTWAVYENGAGDLSLVLSAKTVLEARPVAAVFDILPDNVLPALADLDMVNMWDGVNYNPADIDTFLRYEATRPVAYTTVTAAGETETIMEIERMGYAAKWAFNIADE